MKSLSVIVLFALSLLGVAFALSARAQQKVVFVPARAGRHLVEGRAARNVLGALERLHGGSFAQRRALRAALTAGR